MTVTLQRSQSTRPITAGALPLWPVRLQAVVVDGAMSNAIFVYEAKTRDGQPSDSFRAVASVQQMLELAASREQRGSSSYYRSTYAYFALRNPSDVTDVIDAIKSDVVQLLKGWLAKDVLNASDAIEIGVTPSAAEASTTVVALNMSVREELSADGQSIHLYSASGVYLGTIPVMNYGLPNK